jgi:starch synthase (maltosyl-transferring)
LGDDAALDVEDLLTGARFAWHGKWQHIGLDPAEPYRIWRVRPAGGMA